MADESLSSWNDAERFFEAGGADYFNVKLMKTGGIYGALRLIDTATSHGIGCYIGSMIESAFCILPRWSSSDVTRISDRPECSKRVSRALCKVLHASPFGGTSPCMSEESTLLPPSSLSAQRSALRVRSPFTLEYLQDLPPFFETSLVSWSGLSTSQYASWNLLKYCHEQRSEKK